MSFYIKFADDINKLKGFFTETNTPENKFEPNRRSMLHQKNVFHQIG